MKNVKSCTNAAVAALVAVTGLELPEADAATSGSVTAAIDVVDFESSDGYGQTQLFGSGGDGYGPSSYQSLDLGYAWNWSGEGRGFSSASISAGIVATSSDADGQEFIPGKKLDLQVGYGQWFTNVFAWSLGARVVDVDIDFDAKSGSCCSSTSSIEYSEYGVFGGITYSSAIGDKTRFTGSLAYMFAKLDAVETVDYGGLSVGLGLSWKGSPHRIGLKYRNLTGGEYFNDNVGVNSGVDIVNGQLFYQYALGW